MSVIPEKYADLLESNALANVATIGPKGEPQNNPVWFGWDGSAGPALFIAQGADEGRG